MNQAVSFLLNETPVSLMEVPLNLTVLNYLRQYQGLMGTKEGCAEGDCGACTVVIGELVDGELVYKAVNSCVLFVATLDGKQLLTVEHLKTEGALNFVQQQFVDKHASQCGYCTPGFVMAAYGHQLSLQHSADYAQQYHELSSPELTQKMNQLFAGNLCRCTGYGPIIDSGVEITKTTLAAGQQAASEYRQKIIGKLEELKQETIALSHQDKFYWKPTSTEELVSVLAEHLDAKILAGGTDLGLWVSKLGREIKKTVYLGSIQELRKLEETDSALHIYAGVSYTEAMDNLIELSPEFEEYLYRHSSTQIRNSGTIVGNIANGSPIGDMPPPLLVLGAELVLKCLKGSRQLPLSDYFIDYGEQAILPGEFIEKVMVPKLKESDFFRVYKISKRFEQDISAVSFAGKVSFENDQVSKVVLAFGGMAAIPKRAIHTEALLLAKPFAEITLREIETAIEQDFTPLTDFRASQDYRYLVSKNLVQRFLIELMAEQDISNGLPLQLLHTGEVRHVG